eukprot:scaffold2808_cov255-Pinguiococcus_pyrenoidosus.AAC.22
MVPLFSELPEARRLQIGQLLEFRAFSPGEIIARQGDHDRGVYMLLQGRIKATFRSSVDDEDDKFLAIMEKVSAAPPPCALNRSFQPPTRRYLAGRGDGRDCSAYWRPAKRNPPCARELHALVFGRQALSTLRAVDSRAVEQPHRAGAGSTKAFHRFGRRGCP